MNRLELPASQWVSYGLARLRVLQHPLARSEACDAPRQLLDSAEVLGFPRDEPCPVCGRNTLWGVYWVFGSELGERSGTARAASEIETLVQQGIPVEVHEVEVCASCGWNYLLRSAQLN
ncbi:MAG: DUF5318 family protein [Corynebacterium sp.]|nr:DUF5318 family protein [Corynebacterium sp.]